MKTFYTTTLWNIELQVVQCYREDEGFELLAHANAKYITWCLVAKVGQELPTVDYTEVLELLLLNVRNVARVDDVVGLGA